MPLCVKILAQCESCGEETEDIVLLSKWYPTWGKFASKIGKIGWLMRIGKGEDWDLFCPKCKYNKLNK